MIKHIGAELRVKPKPRARSAQDLGSKPESKAKPEIERGGSGERAWGAPYQKILKIHTWNRAIWCIVQLFKQTCIFPQWWIEEFAENEHIPHFDPSQIQLYSMSLRTL